MRKCATVLLLVAAATAFAAGGDAVTAPFPPPLSSYADANLGFWDKLLRRAKAEPLNAVATGIFLVAIIHTFLAPKIMHVAHRLRDEHRRLLEEERASGRRKKRHSREVNEVSFRAEILHFLGEVEAIFGLWVIALIAAFVALKGWPAVDHYINNTVHFTEPMFVVVIMTIAATRPILQISEKVMTAIARLGGGGPAANWLAILTVGPLLGSFITEPAAMTICALLLSRRFYDGQPIRAFGYATLGLLFVNISIGGTLTPFAAPPVLMVSGKWNWGMEHMLVNFGWKAVVSIVLSNLMYFLIFRKQFATLRRRDITDEDEEPTPLWITVVHMAFLVWTVFTAHDPAFFIGGFLFFLAFASATEHHQNPIVLRPALLVGFFLAGLVIHGGLQAWWIAPVIESLSATPLFFGSVVLTAFNDNAAITFLASLVPNLNDALKYAVVAGAVTGGGLTVIANAPNPAGQAILMRHFPDGISPLLLLLGALPPTIITAVVFLLFR